MLHQRRHERNVVLNAVDVKRIERVGLGIDGRDSRRTMGHELGDHRIVVHRDLAALFDAGIVTNREAIGRALGGRAILHEASDGGQEVAEGVLA